ncbi:hypothetical protein F53441_4353 [Fusarium austroafricanum]|uniref:Frequency clock protein n=1 Tax=Fusarium austroafricanum TaxID=2364996 RepID=A0A8H4P1T7_9HYPO|nr:hypothetical protein F53441_4353 [Fusarium austroafricanum]
MPSNPSSSHRTSPPTTDQSLHLNSLSGSHETGPNDPPEWHNDSSHNATTNNDAIDINVPFFRKESDLWNTESPYSHPQYQVASPMPLIAHSSSVDDYRSVIDDLTLEIQQLRKELRRYKQPGPATLCKDKPFEIKVHGLPQKKKRELEAILRDLATNLDGSPEMPSSQKKKNISPHNRNHIYSKSGIQLKRAPSSPGSSLWPADSAYASMSAGAESSSTPFNLPILTSTQSSKGKVEDYLRDIPDGLYPRHVIMTDKERKSLVVRRLEQLFTGRSNGANISKMPPMRPGGSFIMARVVSDAQVADPSSAHELPTYGTEPIREARILPLEQRSRTWRNNCHLSDYGSASDPNKDNMETGGDGGGLASDSKPFQLSPDAHKIRWRGGSKDTKFSGYSSGYNTSETPSGGNVDVVDKENPGESGLGLKYSTGSAGKWQRHEGAITYYSGAPFCIDLTGNPANLSPTTRTLSSIQPRMNSQQPSEFARSPRRITSRSCICYKPLTDRCQDLRHQSTAMGGDNNEVQGLMNDGSEQSSDIELDLIWNNDQQYIRQQPLEPCGLGGVRPDDHFMVFVDTKRPKQDILPQSSRPQIGRSNKSIERTIRHRATMLTSGPVLGGSEIKTIEESRHIEIEYLSWHTERLIPVPLPSPTSFFPPFSAENSTSGKDDDLSMDAYNAGSSEEDIG